MHITSDLFFTAIVLRLGWRGASPPKELLTFAWLAAFGSFFLFLPAVNDKCCIELNYSRQEKYPIFQNQNLHLHPASDTKFVSSTFIIYHDSILESIVI
ncbi:hypothetical protein HWB74_gp30 [Paenibacillus phage Jacopo]|nr:hypothetical protein HWB74_gp30 [Paenibacillus phage Jacopo]AXF40043.1 hypothetical protein BLOOM_30 [Paenibacillus phage Bloom]AXF40402.1 hypothetical protein LYCANUS1_30 [Paenibacillus phage Genki]AXF42307.1 hypothetical protein LYCANUS2_30 [Paenibacillus phage Gryphonian]AXH45290.1 hypothetical protein ARCTICFREEZE_30 [Paenibacillus phage Arcticfreeze]AXF40213.1 hypothetical protein JACOPO_30 [Paenibacillus phage Jacopo]